MPETSIFKDVVIPTVQVLITALGLYLGPKLAVAQATKQFHKQKLWERRSDKYCEVIQYLIELYDHYINEYYSLAGEPRRVEPQDKAVAAKARKQLAVQRHLGGFLISLKASKILGDAYFAFEQDPNLTDYEYVDKLTDKLKDCIDGLKEEAVQDLKE